VLRVDMRGHGGSAPPAPDVTLDELAGDIAAVMTRAQSSGPMWSGFRSAE